MQDLGEKEGLDLEAKALAGLALRQNDRVDDVKYYKKLLKEKVGAPFVTNVLRVALNYKEERIAG